MRYNWMRRGRMTKADIWIRKMRRAWNDWDGMDLADFVMGWGIIIVFVVFAGLCLVAYLKIGA